MGAHHIAEIWEVLLIVIAGLVHLMAHRALRFLGCASTATVLARNVAVSARSEAAVLSPSRPHIHSPKAVTARVVSYNCALLPFPLAKDGDTRVRRAVHSIPATFSSADVLVLTELISQSRSKLLMRMLAPHWPHASDTPRARWRFAGGVRVLSRHPIIRQATHVFAATEPFSPDALAAKGVVYCEVVLPDERRLHVFATHLHAPDCETGQVVRVAQAAELLAFVRAQRIPASDTVLLAGDFNVDIDTRAGRDLLAAREPDAWTGELRHTVNEPSNQLVEVERSWLVERFTGKCYARLLDGVLAHQHYQRPRSLVSRVVPVRDDHGLDLSDHHAVETEVQLA